MKNLMIINRIIYNKFKKKFSHLINKMQNKNVSKFILF
jgi:hypothetical protein